MSQLSLSQNLLGHTFEGLLPSCLSNAGPVIALAKRDLGFSVDADCFGAYWIDETPTGKTIKDETPYRKARTELATTGSVFDTTNYFEKTDIPNAVLGANSTDFTFAIRCEPDAAIAGPSYAMSTFDAAVEGVRIGLTSGHVLHVAAHETDGTIISASSALSQAEIQSLGPCLLVGVYDASENELRFYINGVLHATATMTSFAAATLNTVKLGVRADSNSHYWAGNIFEAQVWNDQALTAAEVVKLWDKEISYFQGDKAPSVAWLLDGPTCVDLIDDNDLSPVADPSAYSGSFGSTWLNDQGWGTTVYKSDWSSGLDGWSAVNTSTVEVVDFEGQTNVLKLTVGDAASERMELASDFLTDGESYTLKFDIYIPSSNTTVDAVRWTASALGGGTLSPSDVWTSYTQDPKAADTANPLRLYAIAGGAVTGLTVGDVFYLANVEIISEESIYPKRWDADLNSKGYAGDANSFGPCRRNREYRNGPAITLDGTMGAATTYDASLLTELSVTARVVITDTTGDQTIVDQSNGLFGWGFRIQEIDATTSELFFFHYPLAGGAADTMATATAIVTKDVPSVIGVSWDAASGDADFYVNELAENETQTAGLGGIRADVTPMRIGLPNDVDTQGLRGKLWDLRIFEKKISAEEFEWVRTQGESGTEPTNMVRHWPVIEEAGVEIQDIVAGDVATFINDPTWDFTANDSYFHGETVGYSSVPIFVDGVELVSTSFVNYDGIKSSTIELDYVPLDFDGTQVLFTSSSVSPFRIETTNSNNSLRMFVRDSTNANPVRVLETGQIVGQLYQYRIVITEDEDNPTTASSIVMTDRITGAEIARLTGLDIAISYATSNNGQQQLGSYATATNSFKGDLYRFRHWAGSELVGSVDFPSFANAGSGNDFSESGGTLAIKKIPAASKALDANGYPTTNPAGPYHNRTAAEVTETPVANSDSVNPTYYGASFDGTTARENLGNRKIVDGFDLEFMFYISSSASEPIVDSTNNNSGVNPGLSITKSSEEKIGIVVRGASGAIAYTSSTGIYNSRWTKVRVNRVGDTITFYVDGDAVQSGSVVGIGYAATESTNMYLMGHIFSNYSPGVIRNLSLKTGSTVLIDRPYLKDNLDRSDNADHGDGTGITFLSNAMETDTTPDIAEHENRAVTDGDHNGVSIGAR